MSPQKNQYQAYAMATRTVAKTRQIVMLYDGAIRFLKQAMVAIEENRIEDRFKLLVKASEIIVGLQGSIDFEKGGDVAPVLHRFYTAMSMRILSVNFKKGEEGVALCRELTGEIKQMRNVWENIDHTLNTPSQDTVSAPASPSAAAGMPARSHNDANAVTVSA